MEPTQSMDFNNNNTGFQVMDNNNNNTGFQAMDGNTGFQAMNNNDGNFFQSQETQQNQGMNFNNFDGALEGESGLVDEEEEKRLQARRDEENERRSKIVTLMNEEIRVKQEYRDKAREFLDNFR